jgi:hypothetical protein
MYQKNGRWWWKVRLPGEPRVRARALKPEGSEVAAKTSSVAERVAGEMWRLAIEEDAAARARAELEAETQQKVARAKTKAADAVAEAEAEWKKRIEACETALAEAEGKAKLEASLRAEAEEAARSHAEGLERVVERTRKETELRIEAEQRAKMESQARAVAEARLKAETELRAEAEQKAASRVEGVSPSNRGRDARETVTPAAGGNLNHGAALRAVERVGLADAQSNGRTAQCEACGRDGVPENHLSRIDSGQLVCPDCMVVART